MKAIISTLLIISSLASSGQAGGIIGTLVDSLSMRDEVRISTVTCENAYVIGLEKKDFDVIENAQIARYIIGAGPEITVIEAVTSEDADRLRSKIESNYEFAACDRADQVIIASAHGTVLIVKGKVGDTETVLSSFGSILGRGKVKIITNPAKKRGAS